MYRVRLERYNVFGSTVPKLCSCPEEETVGIAEYGLGVETAAVEVGEQGEDVDLAIRHDEVVDVALKGLEGGREDGLGDGEVDGTREVKAFLPNERDAPTDLCEGNGS